MDSSIVTAVITSGGTLGAALIAVFKEEIRRWMNRDSEREQAQPSAPVVWTEATIDHGQADSGSRRKPFDSQIEEYQQAGGSTYLFRVPVSRLANWGAVAFIAGWLLAWTVGVGWTARVLFSAVKGVASGNGTTEEFWGCVLMGGWLLAAIVGEFGAVYALKETLNRTLGSMLIQLSASGVKLSKGRARLGRAKEFLWRNFDGFGDQGESIFFRYGKRRIVIPVASLNEAEWLAQRLNDVASKFFH